MLRLGHREATAHVATSQRRKILFLLFGRAMLHQDFHVSDVRRLAVEQVVADWRASELFTDKRKLRKRQAQPAVFLRQVRRPQTHCFYFVTLCGEHRDEIAERTSQEVRFEWIDLGAQEFFDPVEQSE